MIQEINKYKTKQEKDLLHKYNHIIHNFEINRKSKLKKKVKEIWNYEGKSWTKTNTGQWQPENTTSHQNHKETDNDDEQDHDKDHTSDTLFSMEIDFNENLQSDDGANINATNNKNLLTNYTPITPRQVNSINNNENENDNQAQLTGYGYMQLQTTDNKTLPIKVYYGENLNGTVISPTAITKEHINQYSGFLLYANIDDKIGQLRLTQRSGGTTNFPLK
jgi:hypothetical protein